MRRVRKSRAFSVVCAIAAFVVMGLGALPAQAQNQSGGPAPITDYANYPLGLGLIPAGCTAQGDAILEGELYAVNGGAPAASLRDFPSIPQDAVVTMTWTSFAPGCEGIGVSLSRKISGTTNFDPNDNQYLNVWAYCGPGGPACTAPFSLTLNLAASPQVACYQMDANVGPPLNIVGPAGSYYSLNGGFNMLISANNGGAGDCTPPPCETNPQVPAQSAECLSTVTTTTAPPTTAPPTTAPPTTAPPTTTPAPTTTTAARIDVTTTFTVPPTTATPVSVLPTVVARGALPFTGGNAIDSFRLAVGLITGGVLLLIAAWRWRAADAV